MTKPPKTLRPPKGPIRPPQERERLDPTIGITHEKLIGRIVVAWSRIEGILEDFIWHLLELEMEVGRTVTTRLDATAKIKMIRDLSEMKLSQPLFHRLSPILDQIDVLRDDRNLIMHGTWGRNELGVPIALSLRAKPLAPNQLVSEEFSDTRMRKIVSGIETARLKLMALMKDLDALPDRPTF